MDYTTNNHSDRVGRSVGRHVRLVVSCAMRNWKLCLAAYACILIVGGTLVHTTIDDESQPLDETMAQSLLPRWGGFHERPMTNKCYRQERTAMLLNLWLGCLGVDQFYAHHWPLAVFKLLTLGGGGLWALVDLHLWMVGGVYGTPGCPGGNEWRY